MVLWISKEEILIFNFRI